MGPSRVFQRSGAARYCPARRERRPTGRSSWCRTAPGALVLALLLVAAPALAACSGGSEESAPDLLAHAEHTWKRSQVAHFVSRSSGAPDTGTVLTGGEGEIARPPVPGDAEGPDRGLPARPEGDLGERTVYAQLPFTTTYSVVDPAQFGFGDPGALLDPDTGISQLLAQAESAKLGEEKRVGGEVVREVTAQIPGELVEQILTSKDPSKPVDALSRSRRRAANCAGPS